MPVGGVSWVIGTEYSMDEVKREEIDTSEDIGIIRYSMDIQYAYYRC